MCKTDLKNNDYFCKNSKDMKSDIAYYALGIAH